MAREIDKRFVAGLLIGAGLGIRVGVAVVALIDARRGGHGRRRLLEHAADVVSLVPLPGRPGSPDERRSERRARSLQSRVERMRSAGY